MQDLAGKVMAITGGAAGIGLAVARTWLAGGGRAVLLDFSADAIDAALSDLGEQARGVHADVGSAESVDAAYASIEAIEGRLDAVVNCAGQSKPGPTATLSDADWDALVNVHLSGTMRSSRAAYRLLKQGGGAIVNLSSISASHGMPGRASYCAVKAGIEGLTRELAVEWAPDGIRVNAVAPGYTLTALVAKLIAQGAYEPEPVIKRIPLNRMAQPEEIARPIVFLASDDASFITGSVLTIDGGMSVEGNWYR